MSHEAMVQDLERAAAALINETRAGHVLGAWHRERCMQAAEALRFVRYPADPPPPCLESVLARASRTLEAPRS